MKLAFSTNAYTRFGVIEAIRDIAEAGFGGVEILADVPHAYPDSIDSALVSSIRKALDETGLAVSNINCNCSFGYWKDAPPEAYFEPSLISPNPQHRADRTRMILKTLEFARDVGAENISITSGRCLGGMPPAKAMQQLRASIAPILDRAEQLGVNLGVECEPGLLLEYATELKSFIDHMGSTRLGANLDIGHSEVLGEGPASAIQLLGPRIWNMHVEDIPNRKHYHMIPGEGTMPWPAIREALRAIRYPRFLTVELYTHTADPQSAARKSAQWLKDFVAW